MTRADRALMAAGFVSLSVAVWTLTRRLDVQHAERMTYAAKTYRAVTDAIADHDKRADRLLADVKNAPRRRRTS